MLYLFIYFFNFWRSTLGSTFVSELTLYIMPERTPDKRRKLWPPLFHPWMGTNWFAQKVWTNIQISSAIQWRHLPGLQLKHCIWLEVGPSVILTGHHTRAAVTDWNHISMNEFLPNPGPMSPHLLVWQAERDTDNTFLTFKCSSWTMYSHRQG